MTKWYVSSIGGQSYIAESYDGSWQIGLSAHCLACAKSDILAKHGGRVDTRGHNNICGSFLKAMQATIKIEKNNDQM